MEYARSTGSRRLTIVPLGFRVTLEAWGHLPAEEGLRRCDGLLAEQEGKATEGFIRGARSIYLSLLGHADEAQAEITRARELMREYGYELNAAASAMTAADERLRAGRPEEAEAVAREGLGQLEAFGETGYMSTVLSFLAEALYRQGRHDEAERYSGMVPEIASVDDFDPQMRWRAVQAKVLAQRGAFDEADELSLAAVAITAETDWVRHHADALVSRAEVLELAGRADEAAESLREAIELYERKQARPDVERARARLEALASYGV